MNLFLPTGKHFFSKQDSESGTESFLSLSLTLSDFSSSAVSSPKRRNQVSWALRRQDHHEKVKRSRRIWQTSPKLASARLTDGKLWTFESKKTFWGAKFISRRWFQKAQTQHPSHCWPYKPTTAAVN